MVPEYMHSALPAVRDLFRSLRRFRHRHRKTRIDEVRFLFAPGEGGPDQMRVNLLGLGKDKLLRVVNKAATMSLPNLFAVKDKEEQAKVMQLITRVVYDSLWLEKEEVFESNMKLLTQNNAMSIRIHRGL